MSVQELTNLFYHVLEISVLMIFLYGLKRKMYHHNFTGFITVCLIGLSFILAYVVPSEWFTIVHYSLIVVLLLFIVFYGVYKKHKRSCYA